MEGTVRELVRRSRADYTEVRWEEVFRSRVVFQRDQLLALEATEERGGIVRALVNGAWGLAVFTHPEELPKKIEEAVQLARTASRHARDRVALAEVAPVEDRYQGRMGRDIRGVPLEEKRKLVEAYNRIILEFHPAIVSSSVRYADSLRRVIYANSEGTYIEQEVPDVTLMLAAVARKNGDVQQGFESLGFAGGFELALGHEEKARAAAQRAVDLLSAKPVKGGRYTVILDQDLAGVFIHEAFGHICEADFLLRNEPMRRVMTLGKRFGVETLNVVDDGFIPGARGNCPYDDEGVPRRRVYLIREGVLTGLLHSRATAKKLGAPPTGNARAVSWEHEPIVRMRNTFIEPGPHTFEEMLEGIEYGIYACGAFGGQTEFEQFTFSAAYGYEIVRGKIGAMVRDVVLTGNVFHTLRNIEMIGKDFQLKGSAGGCGKGGQWPLPITTGAPHVRVRDVIVGGR
ncbi:MAG: TldD/PmbA family protein [Candidatus Bipolaricaulota bacterium]|nr:TldD/PmbA family protein [Candidatus Bipolaricaulota bacterium]MDW8152026.1 TldD/PmbA family protein [Candidatus Bipolaricaulota bacterium]